MVYHRVWQSIADCFSIREIAAVVVAFCIIGMTTPVIASELVISSSNNIRTLDPAMAYEWENFHITSAIGAGLYRWNIAKGAPVPDLAKGVEVEDDGKRLVFTLHEDIKFQNGRDITANDFVYSFKRILSPKTKSPFAGFYANVAGVQEFMEGKTTQISGIVAKGKHRLEINLNSPDASILTVLSMSFGFVVPEEEAEKPEFGLRPVGAGPYKVIERDDEQLILSKSEYYKRGNLKSVDQIILKLQPSSGARTLLDIERGKVHFAEFHHPTAGSSRFSADEFYADLVVHLNEQSTIYLAMNTQSGPLENHLLRQALNLGIDKNALIERHIAGKVKMAKHILPPSLTIKTKRKDVFAFDLKKAKSLLRRARMDAGLELKLLAQDSELNRDVINKIAQDLLNLGIMVNPDYVSTTDFLDIVQTDQHYDLFYSDGIAWIADYPDPSNFYFPLFTEESIDSGFNWSRFQDQDMHDRAELINAMTAEEDTENRMLAWDDFLFEMHTDYTPWVPLFHRRRPVLVAPEVRGLEPFMADGMDGYIFENLWIEK